MEKNKVSIIMPAYNSAKFIKESIDSVLQQTYRNWELVIFDDLSTDNTMEILKEYSIKDERIRVFQNDKNSGAAISRNNAIKEAKGRFIAFLDSDDIWIKDKLTVQIKFMEDNNYPFSCTKYGKIDEESNILKKVVKVREKSTYKKILTNVPGNLTVIYDTKYIEKTYIPDIKKRNDLLMWLRVSKKTKYLYGLDMLLAYHRIRSGSISSDKRKLIKYQWQVYRKHENLNIFRASYTMLVIITKGVWNLFF